MDFKELGLNEEQLSSVEKYIQSETDKVRTDYSTKLKGVNEELSKYKPKDKTDDERALDERIKALEEREKVMTAKEKKESISSKLGEVGLPKELADYLNIGDDIDSVLSNVGNVLNTYILNNNAKPNNGHAKPQQVTKEQFKKMGYSDKVKLYNENPTLYNMLSK